MSSADSELNLHYRIYIYIYISVQWVCSVRAKKAQLKSETLEVRSQFKPFSGSRNTQRFQMGPQ